MRQRTFYIIITVIAIAVFAAIFVGVPELDKLINDKVPHCVGAQEAATQHDRALKVASFAIENFNTIDTSRNGEITDGELTTAIWQMTLTDDERDILHFMRENLSKQPGTGQITNRWFHPDANRERSINLDDLHSYPDRVAAKYQSC